MPKISEKIILHLSPSDRGLAWSDRGIYSSPSPPLAPFLQETCNFDYLEGIMHLTNRIVFYSQLLFRFCENFVVLISSNGLNNPYYFQ